MSITHKLTMTKIAAGLIAVAMIVGVLFSFSPTAKAITASELVELLISLGIIAPDKAAQARAAVSTSGGSTSGGGSVAGVCPHTWSVNLKIGSTGADVMALQKFLNGSADTQVAASGAGSPGSETSYYGPATGAAVMKFQMKHAADILTPLGLTTGTTNFFASTRAKANALCVGGTTGGTTTGTTPAPTGTGLSVSAGAQPTNSLAVFKASRVPFTKFMVTAGNDGDVVLNSVTVERKGLGSNAAFDGIVLLDENGLQVGIARTLNSDNKATIGEAVTIPRGTTKTFTVAGNMETSAGGYDGQQVRLDVVGVNTSATVTGALPIMGATHTINESLTLGTVTPSRGALDPGVTGLDKEAGTTGYNFSSVKFTAGSGEDVYLQSIRFEQTGSAGAADVANVVVVVDGTTYPTVVTGGKYYTATFPGTGILIAKGNNKDVTLRADIVGGSNRTIDFDISKRTDAYFVGKTFGYGLTPAFGSGSGTDDSLFHTSDDPWFDASEVDVTAGNMIVSVWTAVTAQNIAINQADQPLGGFSVDVKGEPVTVGRLEFNLANSDGTTAANALVDNVTLVDQNGSVLAGPVDASSAFVDALVFTDSITFPVGVTNVTMKGKLDSTWTASATLTASTTPSSDFEQVKGQNSGKTITPAPASALAMSTMTGKAPALTVSVSPTPIAQTVIAGAQDFVFANYIFDATASGEDVRVTSIPLAYGPTNGASATDLTGCQLWDGATAVVTGSNVKNPTSVSSSTSFVFDGTGLVVAKGTSKTIGLSCDVRTGASGAFFWGLDSAAATNFTGASGVTSGTTVTESLTESDGQQMSLSSGGSLTATLDTGSPSYKIVSSGATGVELARIKFSAANEDIDVKQVALQLSGVSSNTPTDLVGRQVTLWTAEGVQVGTAVFPTSDHATSSQIAVGAFRVMKDGSKVLVVKGDIAGISNSGPLTASGDLLKVDYDGDNEGTNGNYGVGVASGSNVTPASSDTASQGVRVMAAYPVFETVAWTPATLASGSDKSLYRFKVTAVDGDVALYKFTFNFSSSTGTNANATTSAHQLFAYTDSGFSASDSTFGGSQPGLLNADAPTVTGSGSTGEGEVQMLLQSTSGTNRTYVIPSGASRWFELRGTVASVETGSGSESFTVKLLGDATYPLDTALMGSASSIDSDADDDFIWSPISTTTQNAIADLDFTNGYLVSGLPSPSMAGVTHTSAN